MAPDCRLICVYSQAIRADGLRVKVAIQRFKEGELPTHTDLTRASTICLTSYHLMEVLLRTEMKVLWREAPTATNFGKP